MESVAETVLACIEKIFIYLYLPDFYPYYPINLTHTITHNRLSQTAVPPSPRTLADEDTNPSLSPPLVVPERPEAAHSRGSAATDSPRASAISCAAAMCTATEMRCAANAM